VESVAAFDWNGWPESMEYALKDMNYPGSFLHQLKGDKEGQYSVRVSGNWRVFFEFIDGDAFIVDYGDYH